MKYTSYKNHIRVLYKEGLSEAGTPPGGESNSEIERLEKIKLENDNDALYKEFLKKIAEGEDATRKFIDQHSDALWNKHMSGTASLNDGKMYTNIETLKLFIRDIFNPAKNKTETLQQIRRALDIKDEKVVQFYNGARENNGVNNEGYPVTQSALAELLTNIITNKPIDAKYKDIIQAPSIEEKLLGIEAYYRGSGIPDRRISQFNTTIQLARNIFTNLPQSRTEKTSIDTLIGKPQNYSSIPQGSSFNVRGDKSSPAVQPLAEAPDINKLRDQLILTALLQVGQTESTIGSPGLGNAGAIMEYQDMRTKDPETKKFLDAWRPETMYGLLFMRAAEWIKDPTKVADPKVILNAFKMGVIGKKLEKYPEIAKIYNEIFEKMSLFLNSGVLSSEEGKKNIIAIGELFSEEKGQEGLSGKFDDPGFQSIKSQIDQSLTTDGGGFGIDNNGSLRFYSTRILNSALQKGTLDDGMIMALKGYIASSEDFSGLEKIFDSQTEKHALAVYYSRLSPEQKNLIVPPEKQSAFVNYMKGVAGSAIDRLLDAGGSRLEVKSKVPMDQVPDISEEERMAMKGLFKQAGYKKDYIPIDANGVLDVAYLLQEISEERKDSSYKVTREDIGRIDLLLQFFEKGIEKKYTQLLDDLKNQGDISGDPVIGDLFKKLKLEQNDIEGLNTRLKNIPDADLKTYIETLKQQDNTTNDSTRKLVRDILINEQYRRLIGVSKKSMGYLEDVKGTEASKVLEVSANMTSNAEDKIRIESILNELISKVSVKYSLPETIEGYRNSSIQEKIDALIQDKTINEADKQNLREILKYLNQLENGEKDTLKGSEELNRLGYTQVVERFSSEYSILQDIPPDRLTQYQKELGISQTSIQSGPQSVGTPGSIDTLAVGTSTLLSDMSGLPKLSSLSEHGATITRTDHGYTLKINDTARTKSIEIKDIPPERLTSTLSDADLMTQMNVVALVPEIDKIRGLISKNPEFQKIGASPNFSQSQLQLVQAITVLTGTKTPQQNTQDTINIFSRNTNSREWFTKLQDTGVFDTTGRFSFIKTEKLLSPEISDSERTQKALIVSLNPQQIAKVQGLSPEQQKQFMTLADNFKTSAVAIREYLDSVQTT